MLFKDLMTYKRILNRHIYTSVISWWIASKPFIPSGTNRSGQYHENHGLTQLSPVPPLLVLCLVFSTKKIVKSVSKHIQRRCRGRLPQTMVNSWYCLDRVIPEGMSQVSRRSEVGNHKQRTLDTQLSSGTFLLLALLRKLVPGLEEINDPKWTGILYQI